MKIIITKKSDDIHACIEGEFNSWACGKSVDEAIGNLICSHPQKFRVEV